MQLNHPITIHATVAAPVEKVWTYWTAPTHITQWNFATPEWHCPSATNDLQPGGRFTSRMEAKDGSFGFDFGGTYDEVQYGKRIAYTMDDGRKAITDFETTGEATHITTRFEAEQQNSRELQEQGWQAILNQFKQYAEAKG